MIKTCFCGNKFKTYHSKVKLGRGKYCSKFCCLKITSQNLKLGHSFRFKKGEVHFWHTHKVINDSGYIEIYSPNHPNKTKRGYVKEHRLVVEKSLGRYLRKDEFVHHINENKQDNRIDNLIVVSHKEHLKLHSPLILKRWVKKEVVPNVLHNLT